MQCASTIMRTILHSNSALFIALIFSAPASATVINFEDYPLDGTGYYNGSDLAGEIATGGATFDNSFTDYGGGCCWQGWAVSNHADTTTPGFGNQYSSYAGGGFGGSGQFGLLFNDGGNISLGSAQQLSGAYLTTSTYSALSMKNGDSFAKKFGGVSGLDEDWLNVTIEGFLGGNATASEVFYLADYRFADSLDDYIIDDWTWVDLSLLGLVDELRFSFGSSDVGEFGINTPSYMAMDNLTIVPEPNTALLVCTGGLLLGHSARNKRRCRQVR
jgi:hypothetical protein